MIREANNKDLEPLIALYKEFQSFHVSIDPQQYRMPDDEFFLTENNGQFKE